MSQSGLLGDSVSSFAKLRAMEITQYLQRINYKGPLSPTAKTLRQLQVAHLQAVPFENLSIHANEPIVLEDQALFEKIVSRRRGGFCYELNGLFAALLRELGFNVEMLSAGVANDKGVFGPDFDHMTLLVTAPDEPQQRWLADVGFGDSFNEPLLLDERSEQPQGQRSYRIDPDGDHLILSQRQGDGDWKPQYRFMVRPHTYSDYQEMCHYHQTSPESHFTQGRVCTRATPDGRITLSGLRFITTTMAGREERTLPDENAYEQLLRVEFGIEMNRSAARL
jgi:N-hydroxyarylamine O-acetyltransferase